ncbi:hypothetical protein HanIR_Chr16g0792911 [Helianthus annuus]|nr:hypothetical protein HanIR_Chr16g0792911 [Helianthus annuus]
MNRLVVYLFRFCSVTLLFVVYFVPIITLDRMFMHCSFLIAPNPFIFNLEFSLLCLKNR